MKIPVLRPTFLPAILRMFEIKKKRYPEFPEKTGQVQTQDNIFLETKILVICPFTVCIFIHLTITVMRCREIKAVHCVKMHNGFS